MMVKFKLALAEWTMEIGQTHLYQGESFENKALFIIAKISSDYRKTKEKNSSEFSSFVFLCA